MKKKEKHPITNKEIIVEYGKRYGYWWKKHREIIRNIKKEDYSKVIDYFHIFTYKLGKEMSIKHISRWNKKLEIPEKYD